MNKKDQKGILLVTVSVLVFTIIIICLSLMGAANSRYAISKKSPYTVNALLLAEAGIEQSMQQLNIDDNFAGYPSSQQFFNSSAQGRGVFVTTIANSASDANAKVLTSTGTIYRYNTNNKVSTRIVKVTAVGTSSGGYSVHTGPGGLILGGSAGILNADVFVNGGITMTGSAHIGTAQHPVNVSVANMLCPTGINPGPTYPTVCSSGEPISMGNSTFIYGATVCATGQTSKGPTGNNIQGGTTGQGLLAGCVAPPVATPIYDKAAHLSRVTTTGTGTSSTYVCSNTSLTPIWPANLKLTGNVSVGSACSVTVKGDVYITGNLDIGATSRITVDASLGATRPNIIVDGTITINGSPSIATNSLGTGIQFISFKSTASCNPNCTTLSGNDLKTSSAAETIKVSGAAIMPGMIFDAYWGKITVGGGGTIGAAIGQTVDLSGAGNVTFGTGLSTGVRTWTISSYQQKYPGQP